MKLNTIHITVLSTTIIILAASCQSGDTAYGGDITLEQPTSIEVLYATPTAFIGKDVLITGQVTSVCQEMGCWLSLDAGNGKALIVRFKDHAFTVPKDLAGKTVQVQGVFAATVEEDHAEEHEHEASDEAEHVCPTGEFTFTASAVRVIQPG